MKNVHPVLVDAWQFECCGEPFAIGDEVRWLLSFTTDLLGPPEARTALSGTILDQATSDDGTAGSFMSIGSSTVWVLPPLPSGPISVTGFLAEDHHGFVPDALSAVHARVTRVRARSLEYRRNGRTLVPVAGSEQLRDVGGFEEWRRGHAHGVAPGTLRDETGFVVDLNLRV